MEAAMTLLPGPSSLQRYRRPEYTRSVAAEQRADGFEVVLGVGVVQGVVAGGQTRNLSRDEDALVRRTRKLRIRYEITVST